MRTLAAAFLPLCLATCLASPAHAAWPNSPYTNLPVCTAANSQISPQLVADGTGGAFITWSDNRGGAASDIYIHHVLQSGAPDPAWPTQGRAVCTAPNNQISPLIISDGSGGALVEWLDSRATASIYVQHVTAAGVDPTWPADGRLIAAGSNFAMTTDGNGGAIVAFTVIAGTADLYAHHVLKTGGLDPAWPAAGRVISAAANDQTLPQLAPDGSGGAFIVWQDKRTDTGDIYAQHVLANGTVDPAWTVNGNAVCAQTNQQSTPMVVSDGAGGAVVAWSDARTGGAFDIYADHLLNAGIDTGWPASGRALCTASGSQDDVQMVSDGAGGAIACWRDFRSGAAYDIYAQHVVRSGAVDAAWPVDGRAVCAATGDQFSAVIAADGSGGAYVCWHDSRVGGGAADIYTNHVLASGATDPAWPVDGRATCSIGSVNIPALVADGADGVIVTWDDNRNYNTNRDVFAQRIGGFGYAGTPEAVIASVLDVPNDQGGQVKVSWDASYLDTQASPVVTAYDLLRSVPVSIATARVARGARVRRFDGDALQAGDLIASVDAAPGYWEFIAGVTARHYVSGYSYVAPTPGDSIAGSNPTTAFLVVARNSGNTQYWPSQPKSGYSVDDLAPLAPAPFLGVYSAGVAHLHWDPNAESDLAGYRLYRGATAGFVIGPGNRIAALSDTGYADPAAAGSYYKLTAVDVHGNESPVALLTPAGTVGVDDVAPPLTLAFATPSPNPAGATTALEFTLPHTMPVRLAVYDASGRLERELENGTGAAGAHAERWDLRDAQGHPVGAGVYFARLEADGRTLTRRVLVVR